MSSETKDNDPIRWSDDEIEEMSEITGADIEQAFGLINESSPWLADLCRESFHAFSDYDERKSMEESPCSVNAESDEGKRLMKIVNKGLASYEPDDRN
jgi:hypothetical protein